MDASPTIWAIPSNSGKLLSNISYETILEIRWWHWGKLNGIVTTDVVETILSQASPREEGAEHRWGWGESFLDSS